MSEKLEDLNDLFKGARTAVQHYVIRRFCNEYDEVVRFGRREVVGAAAVLAIVDL